MMCHLQRHHRLRRVAVPSNNAISLAGRDLQETYLKVLLGNSSRSSATANNTSSSVTDSLLSSLVLNLSSSEAEDTTKSSAPAVVENSWFKRALPSKTWKTRYDQCPCCLLLLLVCSICVPYWTENPHFTCSNLVPGTDNLNDLLGLA